jgi:hypothetical protein
VGEAASYAELEALLGTAAAGSCMAGVGACLAAEDEASCAAASCSWIAPVITSESCTANDDAATPPTNCEFTAGDGSTCGAGCSYSHSVSGGGCAPADGPGAALFTCVTTAEREFGTTTPTPCPSTEITCDDGSCATAAADCPPTETTEHDGNTGR